MMPLTVAGLMSGTSADGIDVALVRIASAREPEASTSSDAGTADSAARLSGSRDASRQSSQVAFGNAPHGIHKEAVPSALTLSLLHHQAASFPAELREAILAAQDAREISTAALARLNWHLGLAYADAYRTALAAHPEKIDLVGCHGQTIYHQATAAEHFGRSFPCTWQIGEMVLLAREARVPVYSNFRPADLAAGGQGAPLVPLLDQTLYRHPTRTRVLQNIGGIGNLTVVPPLDSGAPVIAFDTGPGNMVIDTLTSEFFGEPYDSRGNIAAEGRAVLEVVVRLREHPFFLAPPPRTAGREQFGVSFASDLLRLCENYTETRADFIATATAVTADSIALALVRFVLPLYGTPIDLVLSGGGAKNRTLIRWIADELTPRGIAVMLSDDPALPTPLPVEAKEAAAFALLAYMSHHRLPGNVPSATGASQAVVLGQVTCA